MIGTKDIKRIKALGQKKFRDQEGLFVVEGEKLVQEARESGFRIREFYRMEEIGREAMERMSQLSSPSPVLAVVEKPESWDKSLENYNIGPGLYLALDGIRDPGNLGTILRTADWFSLSGVFASPDTVEISNPKVVQSTMGAIFRTRFFKACIPSLCNAVKACGGEVYGTFLNGENLYDATLCTGRDRPVLIVIGNEANGICAETAAAVSKRITIPSGKGSRAESLNAAVATAITVAQFHRTICQEKE